MMHSRLTTRAIALLAAALVSHQAAAMEPLAPQPADIEEVVVIGKNLSEPARSVAERISDEMHRYVRDLNEAHKSRLDADLAKLGQRRLQIAAAHLQTRG